MGSGSVLCDEDKLFDYRERRGLPAPPVCRSMLCLSLYDNMCQLCAALPGGNCAVPACDRRLINKLDT